MLKSISVLAVSAFAVAAHAQYSPRPGESVLRLTVENRGDVYIRLYTKEAPKATAQISRLAGTGFYTGLKFHKVQRTPKPFLLQFGDPLSKTASLDDPRMGTGGSGTKIAYEDSGHPNEIGAVGLAHPANDRDGGDSQFYIVIGPARFLDSNYTVFGKVVSGMDVLNRIELGDRVSGVSVITG